MRPFLFLSENLLCCVGALRGTVHVNASRRLWLVGCRNQGALMPPGAAFHGIERAVPGAAVALVRRRRPEIQHQEHADRRRQRRPLVFAEADQRAQFMDRAVFAGRDFLQSAPHLRLQTHRCAAAAYCNIARYQCTSRSLVIFTLQLMIRHGVPLTWRFNCTQ